MSATYEIRIGRSLVRRLFESGYASERPGDFRQIDEAPTEQHGRGVSHVVTFTTEQAEILWWDLYYDAGASAAASASDGGERGGWQRSVMRAIERSGFVPTWDDGTPRSDLMVTREVDR